MGILVKEPKLGDIALPRRSGGVARAGGEMLDLRNQIMYFTLVDLFTEKTPIQKNRRVKSGSDGFNAKVNRYCGVSHIMTRIYRVIEINARIYRVAIKTYRFCMVT